MALLGVPSFVVSLAFFLGLQGLTLAIVGEGGAVPVRERPVYDIANNNMPVLAGWIVVIVVLVAYAALSLLSYRKLASAGLQRPPMELVLAKIIALSVVLLTVTYLLSQNRAIARVAAIAPPENAGFPWVVPLVGVLFVVWTFVFGRTAYGRHVYAVGGNREAARRAGINVTRIRVSVFIICSCMAAVSGIIAASRLNGVTPGAGAGNTLLYAVGAAVIGGTSLFGGKGNIRDAVIGGLVIATIANGLGLLEPSGVRQLPRHRRRAAAGRQRRRHLAATSLGDRTLSRGGPDRRAGGGHEPGGDQATQPGDPAPARASRRPPVPCPADRADAAQPQHDRGPRRRARGAGRGAPGADRALRARRSDDRRWPSTPMRDRSTCWLPP